MVVSLRTWSRSVYISGLSLLLVLVGQGYLLNYFKERLLVSSSLAGALNTWLLMSIGSLLLGFYSLGVWYRTKRSLYFLVYVIGSLALCLVGYVLYRGGELAAFKTLNALYHSTTWSVLCFFGLRSGCLGLSAWLAFRRPRTEWLVRLSLGLVVLVWFWHYGLKGYRKSEVVALKQSVAHLELTEFLANPLTFAKQNPFYQRFVSQLLQLANMGYQDAAWALSSVAFLEGAELTTLKRFCVGHSLVRVLPAEVNELVLLGKAICQERRLAPQKLQTTPVDLSFSGYLGLFRAAVLAEAGFKSAALALYAVLQEPLKAASLVARERAWRLREVNAQSSLLAGAKLAREELVFNTFQAPGSLGVAVSSKTPGSLLVLFAPTLGTRVLAYEAARQGGVDFEIVLPEVTREAKEVEVVGQSNGPIKIMLESPSKQQVVYLCSEPVVTLEANSAVMKGDAKLTPVLKRFLPADVCVSSADFGAIKLELPPSFSEEGIKLTLSGFAQLAALKVR